MRFTRWLGLLAGAFLAERPSHAHILPYSVRTRDFSAWTPGTRGDTNTIGMAGATLAVPTTVSAAEFNPAGFAMLTGSASAQINKTSLNDRRIQLNGDSIESTQWGFSVTPGPWAYSVAYYSPMTESGIYVSPNTGDTVKTEVSLKTLRMAVGRLFFDDKLALGFGLQVAKALRELNDASSNAYGLGYSTGALLRLPGRFLLAASFSPEIVVNGSSNPDPQAIMPGFNRAVIMPLKAGVGLGWIPSRFFKAGVSATYVGRTRNTGLLADESITTGESPTWVPRLGASYVLAEITNFQLEATAGSYFEASRIAGQDNRLHVTAGIEANPYFINVGTALDYSSGYRNAIVSVGVDVIRSLRAFDIIPKESTPPYNGTLPPVHGVPVGTNPAPKPDTVEQMEKIIEEVPTNIMKRVMGQPTTVQVNRAKEIKKKKQKQTLRAKSLSDTPGPTPGPSASALPSPP